MRSENVEFGLCIAKQFVIVVLVSSLHGTRKTSVEKVSAQKYQTAGRIFWNVSRFISGLLCRLKEDGNSVSPEASNDVTN
jgi:hypothetical protein